MKELTRRSSWMLFSQLLQYPDAAWQDSADEMYVNWCHLIQDEEASTAKSLQEFAGQCLAEFVGMDTEAITAAYVKTFDFSKKANMYLTYGQLGDDRERGPALLKLKQVYEEEEIVLDTDELPDYLPLVLEYVAVASEERGIGLLVSFRKALVSIRDALHHMSSPYRHVLDAMLFIIDQSGMTEGCFEMTAFSGCADTPPSLGCGPMWATAGYGSVGRNV
ncbi:nitrate reductase molybdenum cofactor assembly chaperone [Paenibacillus sp. ACRRX]|uniref:nitrate reductase molybdenum cofactor assembly chaperone n=1 Tax=Paenibacillus sp. ACRRX TaxID=2918206 RepID=UPI001EF72761|nr:nitrate reductase molybdenum cofactor assembly chaperone [Paenibacillus sp. ACRRX]MCG7406989.1 nitrate reductase molybdenum cofactor assembly chaperone [Paenibacillus sp. ACRRX]